MYRVYLVTKITTVLKGQFIFSLRCRAVSFQCFNIEKFAHCRKTRDISYTVCIVRHRDGSAFLYTFAFPRAQVRQFFLRVPISCIHFFRVPLYSRVPVSRSYAPVSASVRVGVGCNSSHARCMCMDGSGGSGQLAIAPLTTPLRHVCAV